MLVILPVTFCLLILSIFSVSDATNCSNSSICNPKKRLLKEYLSDPPVINTDERTDAQKQNTDILLNECLSSSAGIVETQFTPQDYLEMPVNQSTSSSSCFLDFLKDISRWNIFSCSNSDLIKLQASFQDDIAALQKAKNDLPFSITCRKLLQYELLKEAYMQIANSFEDNNNRNLNECQSNFRNRLQNAICIIKIIKDDLSMECQLPATTQDQKASLAIVEQLFESLSKFLNAIDDMPVINPHSDTSEDDTENTSNQ